MTSHVESPSNTRIATAAADASTARSRAANTAVSPSGYARPLGLPSTWASLARPLPWILTPRVRRFAFVFGQDVAWLPGPVCLGPCRVAPHRPRRRSTGGAFDGWNYDVSYQKGVSDFVETRDGFTNLTNLAAGINTVDNDGAHTDTGCFRCVDLRG